MKIYMIMRKEQFVASIKMNPYRAFNSLESAKQYLRDNYKFAEEQVTLKVHGNPKEFPIRIYQTFPIRNSGIEAEVFEIHEVELEG